MPKGKAVYLRIHHGEKSDSWVWEEENATRFVDKWYARRAAPVEAGREIVYIEVDG